MSSIHIPTPAEVRGRMLPSGQRAVLWELVDPLLRLCRNRGTLALLARQLEINRHTLWERRAHLKLPPLPRGRPKVALLTPHEQHILRQLREGKTMAQIALELGVTQQAVSQTAGKAKAKEATKSCGDCLGYGVKPSHMFNTDEVVVTPEQVHKPSGGYTTCPKCSGEGRIAVEVK